MTKYVYGVTIYGDHIVNGQGNKSRGDTIRKILETGEVPVSAHAKSFVTFLAVRLYTEDSIHFYMKESKDAIKEESDRHSRFGGTTMKSLAESMLEELKEKNKVELSPFTLHLLSMFCAHGDTFSKARGSFNTLPQETKEELECLFKI